ncbi:unnamed protein product [Paramecium sonneborni]|uniref:Uncharacterized protein n=1 Tax=Paramecium sonneborni TaxID=65129 RepID=A0A8S1JY25_9CILI|nr:unnamed protein product [Paramecium sonneborni]
MKNILQIVLQQIKLIKNLIEGIMAQNKKSILANKTMQQGHTYILGQPQKRESNDNVRTNHQTQLVNKIRCLIIIDTFLKKEEFHSTLNRIGGGNNSILSILVSFQLRQKFLELKTHVILLQEVNQQIKQELMDQVTDDIQKIGMGNYLQWQQLKTQLQRGDKIQKSKTQFQFKFFLVEDFLYQLNQNDKQQKKKNKEQY